MPACLPDTDHYNSLLPLKVLLTKWMFLRNVIAAAMLVDGKQLISH